MAMIPFALQFSAEPKKVPGCSAKALPAWKLAQGLQGGIDGHPGAEFRTVMSISRVLKAK